MSNIDIRNFPTVGSADPLDYVVLSLFSGKSVKMAVRLFRNTVTEGIRPNIGDGGYWYIGDVTTGVLAEGKTPEFRKTADGIEFKYTSEDGMSWRPLIYYSELSLKFDELTDEDIALLQQPASEMVLVLKQTDSEIRSSEAERAKKFSAMVKDGEQAIASANDTADHPTYVGEDNYVYRWNKEAGAYDKTSVYVKGEGFSIRKVYRTADEMNGDNVTPFKEGDFCIVNADSADGSYKAGLYVRNASGSWDFITDFGGMSALTGKTPQLFVGEVKAGAGKSSAAVTMTPDGEDSEGNPRYLLNYTIPYLSYDELSEDQKAELQRPATQAAQQVSELADGISAAETLRVQAEESRQENEAARQQSERTRKEDYAELRADLNGAIEDSETAAASARNLPKIIDGNWWLYDVASGIYVDSGFAASITKENVEDVLTGDIITHTHSHLRYVAQVYDELPDLSSLHLWSDELGDHEFLLGNDIYVRNETEPTGYANYRLSPSPEGNVWVRIPQVAPGWKIVMVRSDAQ